jgi:hypothetical protein
MNIIKKFVKWLETDYVEEAWEKTKPNLTKILFEVDGTIRELEGEDAMEWYHDFFRASCGRRVDWKRHKFKITKNENQENQN